MEDSLEAPYFLKGLELRNWVYKVFQATWLDRLGLGSLDGISSEKECRQLNTSLIWNASTVSSFEQLQERLQHTKPEKRKMSRPLDSIWNTWLEKTLESWNCQVKTHL